MLLKETSLRLLISKIIVETASGRNWHRQNMMRKIRTSHIGSDQVDYEDRLQDKYGPYLDELDVGWDETRGTRGEWMVLDEIEGRWVPSGVSEKGPIGKMKAWDQINGDDIKKHKAHQKASRYMS